MNERPLIDRPESRRPAETTPSDRLRARVQRLERRLDRARAAQAEAEAIAERGLRQLYAQQQRVALLHRLSTAAAEAQAVDTLLPEVLETISAFAGWPLGHVWLPGTDGVFAPTTFVHGARPAYRPLLDACASGRVPADECPVAAAVRRREPVVRDLADVPALRVAREVGLTCVVALPLCAGGRSPIGALAWYADASPPGADVLELLQHASSSIAVAVERLQQQARLTQSEARYRSVFRQAYDAIFIVQGGSGRFVDANAAYCDMVGYGVDELRTMSIFDIVDDAEDRVREIADGVRGARHVRLGERRHRHRAGHVVDLEVSVTCVETAGEELFVAVGRDVSQRKRHEQELRAARDRAETLARLKDTFLRNMSHEFRTPLAGILGCAEILEADVPHDLREFAAMILQSGTRLQRTLEGVLALSEIEAEIVHPADHDAGALAAQAAHAHAAAAARKGLRLYVEAAPPTPPVRTDARLARRVLDQLLDNAVKFTAAGDVRVAVRPGERRAGEVAIVVEDTGIGIDPAFLPRVFEPFSQQEDADDRTFEGCGVGLALAARSAMRIDARIEVAPRDAGGTRFELWLPVAGARY